MNERGRQVRYIVAWVAAVVALDQATKAWVRAKISLHAALNEGPELAFFRLTYEQNTGLVNSFFQDHRWVVLLAPVIATAFLLYLSRYLARESWIQNTAFALALGGAIGNMIDRFVFGFVTDFIQIHFHFIPFDFPWKYWPPFNIADSAICTGIIILAFTLHAPRPPQNEPVLEKPERA